MTIREIFKNRNFPYIKMSVTKKLSDLVEEFDPHMKCDIVSINEDRDDVFILHLNFKPYENFNKTVAIPSFWDINRQPTLTWFDSGFYNDGKVEVYVMGYDTFEDFFEKRTVEDLRNEFSPYQLDWMSKTGEGSIVYPKGYTEWLENKIIG